LSSDKAISKISKVAVFIDEVDMWLGFSAGVGTFTSSEEQAVFYPNEILVLLKL
jgi:hypothetical protein